MKTPQHRIVGTGLFALDVIVRADGHSAPPTLGGSAGNVLSILGALGWQATPVGSLGEDQPAQTVFHDFEAVGADLRFLHRSSGRCTPVIFQHQVMEAGAPTHRFSFACPVCGIRRRPRWDDAESLATMHTSPPPAAVFYLDRPTQLGVALAEHYAEVGAIVVFEPSAVGDDPSLFARAVRCARIIKYADDRIDSFDAFDLQPGAVEIQTRGAEGLRFRTTSLDPRWMHLGAYELPYLHDTAGAGDWCTAGMIYHLFSREAGTSSVVDHTALASALSFGQCLSTLNCMTEGARGLLSAWKPSRIVHAARQLSEARMTAVRRQEMKTSSLFRTPALTEFADDVSQWWMAPASHFGDLGCCSAA